MASLIAPEPARRHRSGFGGRAAYLIRPKQHRAMRQLIHKRHAALFAELLADMVGQLTTYSETLTSPASDGLKQTSWRHDEYRKY